MILRVTEKEKDLAKQLTEERCLFKEKLGIQTGRLDSSRSNRDITYLGFLSEILVSRVLEVPFNVELYAGQDPGVDLNWEGLKIQVKCSFYSHGNLIIHNQKHLREGKSLVADVFVLVKPVFRDLNYLDPNYWNLSFIYRNKAVPLIRKVELQKGAGVLDLVPKEYLSSISNLINSKLTGCDRAVR